MHAANVSRALELRAIGGICTATVAALLWLASSAAAQPAPPSGDPAFGSGWNVLTLHASAFTPMNPAFDKWKASAEGYVDNLTTFGGYWATVALPTGAGIGSIGVFARDDNAGADIRVQLVRFTGVGSYCQPGSSFCLVGAAPASDVVVQMQTENAPGYVYVQSPTRSPLYTVDNDAAYKSDGGMYVVTINFESDTGLAWKGVDIRWKRQISPAPATASFSDVPFNAQFFAEIEALKASGITAGCTATQFCPDTTVTRRQMAAFLARALGL